MCDIKIDDQYLSRFDELVTVVNIFEPHGEILYRYEDRLNMGLCNEKDFREDYPVRVKEAHGWLTAVEDVSGEVYFLDVVHVSRSGAECSFYKDQDQTQYKLLGFQEVSWDNR